MKVGERVKRLRKARGITGRQLADLAQTSHGRIYSLEGGANNITLRTLSRIADALEVPVEELLGTTSSQSLVDTALSLLQDFRQIMPLAQIPVRGTIPAGTPFTEEETVEEYIYVPEEVVKGIRKPYALRINGNSLSQHGIHEGDNVIVDPDAEFTPGKVYAVRIGNEVAAKSLTSETQFEDLEILGRVIAYGSWHKL